MSRVILRSDWYKDYLYRQLLTGSMIKQESAAATLAKLGDEIRLLRALQASSESARDLARRGLDYVWFNSAGPEAYKLTEKATKAIDQDELEEALLVLNQLIERYPTFAEGWNRRASVHWQLGHYDESVSDCERALRLNPNHYGAWQGIGVAQLELGKVDEACRSLRQALRIIPFDEPTKRSLRRCEELLRMYPHPTVKTRRIIV